MKIFIGKYRERWISNLEDFYLDKRYMNEILSGTSPEDKISRFLEKVDDIIQTLLNKTVNLYYDRENFKSQRSYIKIDEYDVWSMDTTLATIIVPMLERLKECKHGAPVVDLEDVPEYLRCTEEEFKSSDTDENFFKRWDYVMDEMIWAFKTDIKSDLIMLWDKDDNTEYEKASKRLENGHRLFGKYYNGLWD